MYCEGKNKKKETKANKKKKGEEKQTTRSIVGIYTSVLWTSIIMDTDNLLVSK